MKGGTARASTLEEYRSAMEEPSLVPTPLPQSSIAARAISDSSAHGFRCLFTPPLTAASSSRYEILCKAAYASLKGSSSVITPKRWANSLEAGIGAETGCRRCSRVETGCRRCSGD